MFYKRLIKLSLILTTLMGYPIFSYAVTPAPIVQLIKEAKLNSKDVSLWIAPVKGNPVITLNQEIPRNPASVMKLLTTSTALSLLGKDFRWKTEFYTTGTLKKGVLKGDLYIKGYGDPYFVQEDLLAILQTIYTKQKIKSIQGRLIFDTSYFQKIDEDPNTFDGKGTQPYNAIPSALSINFRTSQVLFEFTDNKPSVVLFPDSSQVKVDNQLTVNNYKSCSGKGFNPITSYDFKTSLLTVTGEMSTKCQGKSIKFDLFLTDVGDLFYGHFVYAWQSIGGIINADWAYGKVPAKAKLLHVNYSKPLSEQITAMNRLSNNIMTRQLFLTIAAENGEGTVANGIKTVLYQLRKLNVNTKDLIITNGCGLSRTSRISAAQLGKLLQGLNTLPNAEIFQSSLAEFGKSGTLRKRLRGTPLSNNAIGKTGTVKDAHSVAGYVTTKSGKKFVYAIMMAGSKAEWSSPLQDKILQWVYDSY